jgi:hypothetical protein
MFTFSDVAEAPEKSRPADVNAGLIGDFPSLKGGGRISFILF